MSNSGYQRQYEEESAAYTSSRNSLSQDLTEANRALLDAQDKGADDFAAAQAEVGRKEQEALGGVFEILRQILGADADLIIGLIQTTYDKRRAAYLSEGQATADAAGQANQSEIDQLNGVFEILRSVLGPDADVIISLIQTTYDKRAAAYGTGGTEASKAAELAAASEAQSIANVNQVLRDLFGPAANDIIEQIKALGRNKAQAHREAGAEAGEGARLASESELQSIANINQLLRDLFGPAANDIINQIKALGASKRAAHTEAGAEAGAGAIEGGAAEGQGATEGGDLATQGIDSSTESTTGALETRTATIESFLARDDLTPALRTSLQALDAAFREGGNLTASEIAANRETVTAAINDRGAKIQELVKNGVPLAEAVRQVDTELANTFNQMGAEVSRGATEGGELSAQGVTESDKKVTGAMLLRKSNITAILNKDSELNPIIVSVAQGLASSFLNGSTLSAQGVSSGEKTITGSLSTRLGAITSQLNKDDAIPGIVASISGNISRGFTTAGQGEASAIKAAQDTRSGSLTSAVGAMTGILTKSYSGLENIQSSGSSGFVDAISKAGSAEGGMFTTQGSNVNSAIDRAGGLLTGGLSTMYSDTTRTLGSGSSGFVSEIQRSYAAEQSKFQSESAEMERRIRESKGQEKAELTAQYDAMKREHDAKSAAYVKQIGDSAGAENTGVGKAATLVSGGLGDMGDDEKKAAYDAYFATKQEHDRMSALYRALMGTSATDERKAAILAAVTTGGGLKTMGGDISTSTTSAFGVAKDAYIKQSGIYKDKIKFESDLVKKALEAAAKIIANFKFPPIPKPPPIPSGTKSSGDPGDFGLSTTSFFSPPSTDPAFSSQMGAFADSGMPDYASATGDMRAYAAAASPLIDLFGSRQTLALTSRQEKTLSIDLRFGGADFGRMFDKPLAGLERFSNSIWETAKFERETALLNRDTVERLARAESGGTLEWAKRPRRR